VHADLMRAARLEAHLEEREAAQAFEHPVPCDRAPALASGPHRHPHAVSRVTADRPVDHALVGADAAVDDREIPARDAPTRELCQDRKSTRLNSSHGSISYAVLRLSTKKFTARSSRSTRRTHG